MGQMRLVKTEYKQIDDQNRAIRIKNQNQDNERDSAMRRQKQVLYNTCTRLGANFDNRKGQ